MSSAPPSGGAHDHPAQGAIESSLTRGLLWMALATALFAAMDAVAKALTDVMPSLQATWGRFIFHALLLCAAILLRSGWRALSDALRSRAPALQLVRSVAMVTTNGLFFAALATLSLPTATAVMFLSPLIVTVLAIPFLGEQVGWRRVASVGVGFLGALLIIRPGSDAFQPAALLVVAAACSHAVYQLVTRKLSGADPHATSLIYTALGGAVISSVALPFVFQPIAAMAWVGMAAVGVLGLFSHFAYIRAFEAAEASTIAPFGYLTLIWSAALGYAAFGDVLDGWTLAGAAVIAASGVYILHRERIRRGGSVAGVGRSAR